MQEAIFCESKKSLGDSVKSPKRKEKKRNYSDRDAGEQKVQKVNHMLYFISQSYGDT